MTKTKRYLLSGAGIVFLLICAVATVFSQFDLDNINIPVATLNAEIQKKLPITKQLSIYTIDVDKVVVGTKIGEIIESDNSAANVGLLSVDLNANINKTGKCLKIEPSTEKKGWMDKLQNVASKLSKGCANLSTETSHVTSYTTGTVMYRASKFYYKPTTVRIESDLKDKFLKINKSLVDKGMSTLVRSYLEKSPVYALKGQTIISMAIESISVKKDAIVVNISWLKLTGVLMGYLAAFLLAIGLVATLAFNPNALGILAVFGTLG